MILENGDFSLLGGVECDSSSIIKDEVVVIPGVSDMQDYFGGRLEAECDSEARPIESHTLILYVSAASESEEGRGGGVEGC